MKIALVTTATTVGGVFQHVADLANGAVDSDHTVSVFGADALRPMLASKLKSPVSIRSLDDAPHANADVWHLHLHDTFDRTAFRIQVVRAVRKGSRGVVITEHLPRTSASDSTLPWDPTLPPGRRKPFAFQAKSMVKQIQFGLAGKVIVVSGASAAFLKRRYGLSTFRLTVIPNGVRVGPPFEQPPKQKRLRIVSIGAIGWRKGHDVLIAATQYAKSDWDVTVVGEGPLLQPLREQARWEAQQPMTFAGPSETSDGALEGCDVMCLPSRLEAAPYVLLEAMVRERPVVATNVDGIPELVEHGVSGLLVPAEDPQALAEALDRMSEITYRCQLASAGRKRVVESYDVETMVAETLRVYESLR